jgi:hypothetical protein
VRLVDDGGRVLVESRTTSYGLRLDADVVAQEQYRLLVRGVNAGADVRITNLVRVADGALFLEGTAATDAVTFEAGQTTHELVVNGARYTYDATSIRRVYLFGGDGHDSTTLVGTDAADAAALRPGKVSLRTTKVMVLARGFETATIDGRGGIDAAYFADSAASETFTSWADRAELVGGTSRLAVTAFESVRARSFAGGDTATLHLDAATQRISQVAASTRLIGANVLRELTGFGVIETLVAAPTGVAETFVVDEPATSAAYSPTANDRVFGDVERAARRKRVNAGTFEHVLDAIATAAHQTSRGVSPARTASVELAALDAISSRGRSRRGTLAWTRLETDEGVYAPIVEERRLASRAADSTAAVNAAITARKLN